MRESKQERLKNRREFALDGWTYDAKALKGLMTSLNKKNPGLKERLQEVLEEGGGKAFGLVLCDLIAEKYRDRGLDISVPSWEIEANPKGNIREIVGSVGNFSNPRILRSSAPEEDWLSRESGVLKSYDNGRDVENAIKLGELPDVPFILQDKINGFGAVVDVGYSKIKRRTLVHIAIGNERRQGEPSNAVSDPEASVAVLDASGESVMPAREFGPRSFYRENEMPVNDILPAITDVLKEIGIDFGVQLEVIVDVEDRKKINIIQIRPSPIKITEKVDLRETNTPPEILNGEGEILAETGVVSGAFDASGSPELHLEKRIPEFARSGAVLSKYLSEEESVEGMKKNLASPAYHGNPDMQMRLSNAIADREAEIQVMRTEIEKNVAESSEKVIGFFASSSVPPDMLETLGLSDIDSISHDSAGRIMGGAYLTGHKVIITPGAIIPATKHDYAHVNDPRVFKFLGKNCGMMSLRQRVSGAQNEEEINDDFTRIQKAVKDNPGAMLRVVSDGLVGQVILLNPALSKNSDEHVE